MSQILVFNSGSTSLKFKLFVLNPNQKLKLMMTGSFANLGDNKKLTHNDAIRLTIRRIKDLTKIKIIAHRVVHGGNRFVAPTIIDRQNIKDLEELNYLAPLHNPYNLMGIQSCLTYFGDVPNLAVFDTAFFKNLPLKSKIYPIPFEFYQKYGFERFGFHGTSHQYVAQVAAEKINKNFNKINLITCHLGGGCSVAAIKNGQAVDISLGYTPMEGLMMMTRCGDLDPGLLLEMQKILIKDNYKNKNTESLLSETNKLLNKSSGILGVAGVDSFLKLLKIRTKNPRAKLAFDIFIYRLQKYISAYWGILGDVDAVVFTGNIGSGNPITRQAVVRGLKFLKNKKIFTIKTDEELAIAKECLKFITCF